MGKEKLKSIPLQNQTILLDKISEIPIISWKIICYFDSI
ncbi:Uncharacterised protein [Mycobacteroides abscessus subsp. abscessus]|nr:Uncharacterised protein [Mycobacteroides abscessus subsp. abscessus]